YRAARQQIALLIAGNITRQPFSTRLGPNEHKHGGAREPIWPVFIMFLKCDPFHVTLSLNRPDLGMFVDDNVSGGPNTPRKGFGHARPQRATNEMVHLARRTAFGKKHDGLTGRVAGANDSNVATIIQLGFDSSAGIVNAGACEAIGAGSFQKTPTST